MAHNVYTLLCLPIFLTLLTFFNISSVQAPRTVSIPLRIAIMMRMIEYENWIVSRLQIWRKIKFPISPLRVTSETVTANPALEGCIGIAICHVTLKGLDRNLIFLKICNLNTIWYHILSFSSWLQFARVLILIYSAGNFCINKVLCMIWNKDNLSKHKSC